MSKPRRNGMSIEERVWKRARKDKASPFKLSYVMTTFDMTRAAASHLMCRLIAKGAALGTGHACTRLFTVTDVAPQDLRGTAPGTLRSLAKHSRVNHNPIRKPKHPTPTNQTLLEQLWTPPR